METSLDELGIRKIGILVCFNQYRAIHGRYPNNPQELNKVTATELSVKNFDKYKQWFFDYSGESAR